MKFAVNSQINLKSNFKALSYAKYKQKLYINIHRNNAQNNFMRKFWEGVVTNVKYFTDRRFSTVAGTLVYFLLMSIAPFTLWLTLVFGSINVNPILDHRLLESVSPFLRTLKSSAESAVSGAGIIFLVTALYSSTNFFYHLRRSGEIIYESGSIGGGLKLRLASLGLIAVTIILIALIAAAAVAGSALDNVLFPHVIYEIVFSAFLIALIFSVALVLNIFACPFKLKVREAAKGSLFTTLLWIIFLVGFGVYTRFASPERLYGKIASVIIFLIWCYAMMCCFVIGMILNGKILKERKGLPLKRKINGAETTPFK